jgi:hypothetical protein
VSHSVISLGLGLGGGKSATSSGAPSGGALTDELAYSGGIWETSNFTISVAPEAHYDANILDGADSANNPSDTSAVSAWNDRSGSAADYDATQVLGAMQPVFNASSLGSKPAITSIDDKLEIATEIELTAEYTLVIVAKANAAEGKFSPIATSSRFQDTPWVIWYLNATYPDLDYVAGSNKGDVTTATTVNMFTVTRDGSNVNTLYEGGNNSRTTQTQSRTMKLNKMFQQPTGLGPPYGSEQTTSEILVFTSLLSAANLNIIILYLEKKYGFSGLTTF